jgi:hypothetical protein
MSDSDEIPFEVKREYTYVFKIWCASEGRADLPQVEQLMDLATQELAVDPEFAKALGEGQALTIQILDANNG